MFSIPFLQKMILLCVLFLAAEHDIADHRVPNRLLLSGFLLLGLCKLFGCPQRLLPAAAFAALLAVFLFPLYLLRMTGAADIKAAALILFCSPDGDGAGMLLLSLFLGAGYSLYSLLRKGLFKKRIRYFRDYMDRLLTDGAGNLQNLLSDPASGADADIGEASCGNIARRFETGELSGGRIPPYYDSGRDGYAMTLPLMVCYFAGTLLYSALAGH